MIGLDLSIPKVAVRQRAASSLNLVPHADLDLNFVEGVYRLSGASIAPSDALDIINNESRNATTVAGGTTSFGTNTLPITDRGLWVQTGSIYDNNDRASIKDSIAASIFSAINAGGATVFMEWEMSARDGSDHWPICLRNSDESIFLAVATNNDYVGSFSAGMPTDYGLGPEGAVTNPEGNILRIAMRLKSTDFAFAENVAALSIVQKFGDTSFANFAGGKIWVGSNRYDVWINKPIRRIAVAFGARPDAELTDWVSGISAPIYANTGLTNSVNGAAASALPLIGVATHINRLNDTDIPTANNLAMVATSGAEIVRTDMAWQNVEQSSGVYSFSYYDALVSGLRTAGRKVLLVLDYGNSLYTGGSSNPPTNSTMRTAYNNFCVAVANQYHGADVYYELWNEPNLAQFWGGAPDATQFATMVTGAAAAIAAAKPGAQILVGGISSANWPDPVTYMTTFVGAVTKTNLLGYSLHPYNQGDLVGQSPELAIVFDAAFFAVASGKQKWNTEVGYPLSWASNSVQRQAHLDTRAMIASIRAGLQSHVHYDLCDDGPNKVDDEETYGLFDDNFNIKPTGTAFSAITAAKSGATTYSVDALTGCETTVITFNKSGSKTLVLVAEVTNLNFVHDIGSHSSVSARDVLGNVVPVQVVSGNVVKIPVSEATSPIIVNIS